MSDAGADMILTASFWPQTSAFASCSACSITLYPASAVPWDRRGLYNVMLQRLLRKEGRVGSFTLASNPKERFCESRRQRFKGNGIHGPRFGLSEMPFRKAVHTLTPHPFGRGFRDLLRNPLGSRLALGSENIRCRRGKKERSWAGS